MSPLREFASLHALLGILAATTFSACGEQARTPPSDAGSLDAAATSDAGSLASDGAPADAPSPPNTADAGDASPSYDAGDAELADSALDEPPPLGPLAWESASTTTDDGAIIIERVVYLSDGLRVSGQVCRPHPSGAHGAGPYPVQIVNHGGFSGISDWNGGNCANLARQGWVAAESSYRGEDDSEGDVEVCLGEVTDVLRLTYILRAQRYADTSRFLMSGISHGGCITLRAVERAAPVQLAATIFGPTDWATAYDGWQRALAGGSLLAANYRALIDALERATGGSPGEFPEEYARRSPSAFVPALDRASTPLLVLQGVTDAYVPPDQSCQLASAGMGFQSFHVATNGSVSSAAPTGCESAPLSWLPGPRPTTSWPAQRYLVVYDDLGHNFEGAGFPHLLTDLTGFAGPLLP